MGWSNPSLLAIFVIGVALLLAAGTSGAARLPPLNLNGPLTRTGIRVAAVLGVLCLAVFGGLAFTRLDDWSPDGTFPPVSPFHTPSPTPPPSSETPVSSSTPPPSFSSAAPPPSRTHEVSTPNVPPSAKNPKPTSSPALQRLRSGNASLGTSDGYDFDAGTTGFAGTGADIIVDSSGISSVSSTRLAESNRTDTNPDGCPSRIDSTRVSRSGASGKAFCVLTNGGDLAVFAVSTSPSSVDLNYVLWALQ